MGLTAEWIGAREEGVWSFRSVERSDIVDPDELDALVTHPDRPGLGVLVVDSDWAYLVATAEGSVTAQLLFNEEAWVEGYEGKPWPDELRAGAPADFADWTARWAPTVVAESEVRRLIETGRVEDAAGELLELVGLELPPPVEERFAKLPQGVRRLHRVRRFSADTAGIPDTVARMLIQEGPDLFDIWHVGALGLRDDSGIRGLSRMQVDALAVIRPGVHWRAVPEHAPDDLAALAEWVLAEVRST